MSKIRGKLHTYIFLYIHKITRKIQKINNVDWDKGKWVVRDRKKRETFLSNVLCIFLKFEPCIMLTIELKFLVFGLEVYYVFFLL